MNDSKTLAVAVSIAIVVMGSTAMMLFRFDHLSPFRATIKEGFFLAAVIGSGILGYFAGRRWMLTEGFRRIGMMVTGWALAVSVFALGAAALHADRSPWSGTEGDWILEVLHAAVFHLGLGLAGLAAARSMPLMTAAVFTVAVAGTLVSASGLGRGTTMALRGLVGPYFGERTYDPDFEIHALVPYAVEILLLAAGAGLAVTAALLRTRLPDGRLTWLRTAALVGAWAPMAYLLLQAVLPRDIAYRSLLERGTDYALWFYWLAVIPGLLLAVAVGIVSQFLSVERNLVQRSVTVACPRCTRSQSIVSGTEARCEGCRLRISLEIEEPLCPKCRYALQGLTQPRCPECGENLNPADVAAVQATPQ